MVFDTHTHMFDEAFDSDRKECFKRIKDNNICLMLVGFSKDTNKKAYDLALKYNFYSSAGIHPSEVEDDYDINDLKDFILTHKVYAIGECGLDYHWKPYDKQKQKKVFEDQIKLSIELDLPLIIHSRDALQDTYDILAKYKGKIRGIMHCYSGSLEMAYEFVKLGFYISLGGPLTFKNAKEPKRVAQNISLDNLLIETDSPYLAPDPYRGKRNESSYVLRVLEDLAKIKGKDIKEVENITYKNACDIFRIEG